LKWIDGNLTFPGLITIVLVFLCAIIACTFVMTWNLIILLSGRAGYTSAPTQQEASTASLQQEENLENIYVERSTAIVWTANEAKERT
jgi:flagellar basal body-associated protein FliL